MSVTVKWSCFARNWVCHSIRRPKLPHGVLNSEFWEKVTFGLLPSSLWKTRFLQTTSFNLTRNSRMPHLSTSEATRPMMAQFWSLFNTQNQVEYSAKLIKLLKLFRVASWKRRSGGDSSFPSSWLSQSFDGLLYGVKFCWFCGFLNELFRYAAQMSAYCKRILVLRRWSVSAMSFITFNQWKVENVAPRDGWLQQRMPWRPWRLVRFSLSAKVADCTTVRNAHCVVEARHEPPRCGLVEGVDFTVCLLVVVKLC